MAHQPTPMDQQPIEISFNPPSTAPEPQDVNETLDPAKGSCYELFEE
jgi:hypothetical protein